MVSKFKGLMALEEILARGQFWETIPVLDRGATCLGVYQVFFFLDFHFTLILYSYFF